MAEKLTTEKFIIRASKIHGSIYDYSKTNYRGAHNKVVIICSTHGEFEQVAHNHLHSRGCIKCAREKYSKEKSDTTKSFIEKAFKVHNGRYKYSKVNYTNSKNKIIIVCPVHGEFEQYPQVHLKGCGCKKCADENQSNSSNTFIQKVNEIHKGVYSYKKVDYKNAREKVIISCSIHGDFKQSPNAHLSGKGCEKCNKEKHWSRSDYIKKSKRRICTFYILKCFNEVEEFYKIGMTMNSVKIRYPYTKSMPYAYEVVSEIRGEAGFIWDLELKEKRKLKEFNYQPNIEFGGSKTECFTQYKV